MDIPTLRTPRLLLRSWKTEDADRLLGILQEPDILRYFPRTEPWPREEADRYIAHHLSHWQERGCGHWAVVTPADGQVVGWNGLEFLPETGETEVAYLLSREVWGHGYATEAARAALEDGILDLAQQNAEAYLSRLLHGLGYQEVIFVQP